MIKPHCFSEEWLQSFKGQTAHQRIDTIILEKMIYALHLVEQLQLNGLEFVFKGGTSLVLLLGESSRFSIDIDIISHAERQQLEGILDQVIQSSSFTSWKLDEHRSYLPGVPKAHYKFSFASAKSGSGTILLDILFGGPVYPKLEKRPVETKWIETETPTFVVVPAIDSIAGDKLTAFAPNTIGIPYFKGKHQISSSMEICKQLFDLSRLFERLENMEMVATSFRAFAQEEIRYREAELSSTNLAAEDVLWDTIMTCKIISRRGGETTEEKSAFSELQKGMKAFSTGFLMQGRFRIDEAIPASARVAYLAAKILTGDLSPIVFFNGQDIQNLLIEHPAWTALNRLKKQPDPSSFYYWHLTAALLTQERGS